MFFSPDNLFLLIALTLFARACFCDLKYGVYIITFLMPTYLWRMEIFSIPTTLLELMIYILFLIWLFKKTNHESRITNHESKLIFGIILLFLGLTISTALSDNFRVSIGIFKGWFIDPFLFFLVLIGVVKTKKQIIDLFFVWMLSGLAVAVISTFYLIADNLTYDDRLKAFFLSPNHLAMYLAPAFLLLVLFRTFSLQLVILSDDRSRGIRKRVNCVFQYIFTKHKHTALTDSSPESSGFACPSLTSVGMTKGEKVLIQYPIFNFVALIIILIPLYFTFSYGAFLGIAAAVFYFIFILFRKRTALKYKPSLLGTPPAMTIVIILCSLILFSLLFLSADKFQQITDSQNRSSFHSRLMIWSASKEILKDNFIFGIGPGTFQEVYLSYSDKFGEPYLEWAVPQPHNLFLAFWLQTGLLGLLGFILILIWFFSSALRYKNTIHNPKYSGFTIPIILMIYFLIHGLIDTTYWKNDLSLMFWILIGTMAVCRNNTALKDDTL